MEHLERISNLKIGKELRVSKIPKKSKALIYVLDIPII